MADLLTLAGLGGVAAADGISFLYGQAAEVLKTWRERKQKTRSEQMPAELRVPIIHNGVLDAAPADDTADTATIENASRDLAQLAGALSPYVHGLAEVDVNDADLNDHVRRLRGLLEAVYRQRFTFLGEDREPTGSRVTVVQALGEVRGTAIGVDADLIGSGADIAVGQVAKAIGPDGSVTGVKARRVGGPPTSADLPEK